MGSPFDAEAQNLKINGVGKHRWTVPEDTLSLIRELARLMPDQQIARLLNRAGKPTGRGNGWTKTRVCSFRSHHGISVHREDEWAERGEMTLEAVAQSIGVSVMTALRMIRRHRQGAPALQGRAVGNQGGGPGRVSRAESVAPLANIESRSAELSVSMT